ncbi:uncharacterized protein LOC143195039 isoform X1 [Rhynchophorus ferrugineus]|uniref:uncharacterized protein LOC143195039 isoform X1 n=1 Tax=Rhynchophorus ferrugineus TaxID=354439 RepID=UPI003FCE7B8E
MFEIDDDDFTPSSSSNLFSIFNTQSLEHNANLSYKAPKQPRPTENKPNDLIDKNENQSSVILAKVIHLWKLENGESKLQGKHIVAIIGKQGQENNELIVYKEKTNILIRETLNKTMSFFKYSNNFIGFYDRTRCFWNLGFMTIEEYDSFLKELPKQKCIIVLNTSENSNETSDTERTKQPHQTVDINKSLESPEIQQKNEVLTRITKMGQPILPKTIIENKYTTFQSDSETESSYSDTKPSVTPRKFKKSNGVLHERKFLNTPTSENKLVLSTELSNNNQMLGNNHMMLYPQGMVLTQTMPEYMNNFLIAQNAELKSNIAEINMKLSTVLSNQGSGHNINREEFKQAKSKVKCLNLKIENLTMELDQLKNEHQDLKKSYNNKCKELCDEQERAFGANSLSVEVNFLKNKLNEKEKEIELLKSEIDDKNEFIEKQNIDMQRLEKYHKENEIYKSILSSEIDELKSKLDDAHLKINEYEDKCKEQQELLNNYSKNSITSSTSNDSSKIIKETMNEAFTSIMNCFDESESYSYKCIQNIILANLKHSSLSLITQFNTPNK